ncbi:unnamed protein product [Hapterophycus canaliculatus]
MCCSSQKVPHSYVQVLEFQDNSTAGWVSRNVLWETSPRGRSSSTLFDVRQAFYFSCRASRNTWPSQLRFSPELQLPKFAGAELCSTIWAWRNIRFVRAFGLAFSPWSSGLLIGLWLLSIIRVS